MEVLKFIFGLIIGGSTCATIVWLIFVYPYSDIQLKWYWYGMLSGIILILIAIFIMAYIISESWPRD